MTCQIKFINNNKFAWAPLDQNIKNFVAYISSLATRIIIYLAQKAYISLLLVDKITIQAKYLDFMNIFPKMLGEILLKRTKANKHEIKLKKTSKHPLRLSTV